jgi:hypothetical protein
MPLVIGLIRRINSAGFGGDGVTASMESFPARHPEAQGDAIL